MTLGEKPPDLRTEVVYLSFFFFFFFFSLLLLWWSSFLLLFWWLFLCRYSPIQLLKVGVDISIKSISGSSTLRSIICLLLNNLCLMLLFLFLLLLLLLLRCLGILHLQLLLIIFLPLCLVHTRHWDAAFSSSSLLFLDKNLLRVVVQAILPYWLFVVDGGVVWWRWTVQIKIPVKLVVNNGYCLWYWIQIDWTEWRWCVVGTYWCVLVVGRLVTSDWVSCLGLSHF